MRTATSCNEAKGSIHQQQRASHREGRRAR
jgi:hypothetical protein